jgi:bifunctional DNA-binding transcriptional regulator/antitoxin component of YhaV-PrlF toxin-antitoxin module
MTEVVTTTNITENGQITLPREFCEINHLQAGDTLTLIQLGNQMIIVPAGIANDKVKDKNGWPIGFFEATFGSAPDLPERDSQVIN